MRRCLRPDACPYARPEPLGGDAAMWARLLGELLPGDAELADELTGVLIAFSDELGDAL